jgi:hypothetical protein
MYSEPYLEISIHLVDIEDTLLAGKCNEPLEIAGVAAQLKSDVFQG